MTLLDDVTVSLIVVVSLLTTNIDSEICTVG
jgi:hypothetical protein